MMAHIHINGQCRETTAATVADLLAELKLLPSQVAVEYNGTVLFRQELDSTQVKNSDRIEIVRVVAGG